MYAWGDADVDLLRNQIEFVGSEGYVALHMNDLWSAFKKWGPEFYERAFE